VEHRQVRVDSLLPTHEDAAEAVKPGVRNTTFSASSRRAVLTSAFRTGGMAVEPSGTRA
jgi:hypothetical protein